MDAGGATPGSTTNYRGASELGITNTGTPLCINDAPTNTPGGYHQFCLGANSLGGGLLSYTAIGGAPALPLQLLINGGLVPIPGTVTGMPQVISNAALQATSSTFSAGIVRLGFSAPGDSPPLTYVPSAAPCPLNGGNGDGAAQIKSSDGKCFLALFPASGIDVRWYGAKIDGTTNDSTAYNAASSFLGSIGGGTIIIPATGHCMMGQNLAPQSNVLTRGDTIGACAQLIANATQPLFQTPNAYKYMQRTLTGSITQASSTIPVSDVVGITASNDAIFVIDNGGVPHTATVTGVSGSNIIVNPATWSSPPFSAPAGSWWGDLVSTGPVNVQFENLYIDGNKNNQPLTDSLVAAQQTVSAGGNLALVGGTPTATPYSNILLNFGSTSDLSAVTFTVTCTMVKADIVNTTTLTLTAPGPNNSISRTTEGCNKVTNIAVSGGTATNVSVGWADGPPAGDGIVLYGAMPRMRDIIAQNFRGWCFRSGFVPGTGFVNSAPSGSNWQTQEHYHENLQCLSPDTGVYWDNGPNDGRIKGITANFFYGYGLWIAHWCGGCTASNVHMSGGNAGTGFIEPLYGILDDTDSFTCVECKSEEAKINFLIRGNNFQCDSCQAFHIDPTNPGTALQLGDNDYTGAASPISAYRWSGIMKNQAIGVNFVKDGGGGRIDTHIFNSPASQAITGAVNNGGGKCKLTVASTATYAAPQPIILGGVGGAPCNGSTTISSVDDATHFTVNISFSGAYTSGGTATVQPFQAFNGTPLTCGSDGSTLNITDDLFLPNSYRQDGACASWNPIMNVAGVAIPESSAGEIQGRIIQGRITLATTPGVGAITITGIPTGFAAVQTCPVQVSFTNNATGLTGTLAGFLQGSTITVTQWGAVGTGQVSETNAPSPFVTGTNFFFTAGPCVQ